MKLLLLIAAVALSNAAKLDKTYLPPRSAQSAGGSSNFLQTPLSGPSNEYQGQNGLPQRGNGFAQRENGFAPRENGFAQRENGFAPRENGFAPRENSFAQRENGFTQSENGFATDDGFTQDGNGFENLESRPERPQASFERNAGIVRLDNQNDGETYSYAYETENGIYAEESGVATNGVEAQGGFSYTGDDGQVYSISYTADQNGFVPQGDHLPTPPPVPEEILKALEQNARDETAGIYDDGSYNEAKYSTGDEYNTNSNYNNNAFNNNEYNTNAYNTNEYEGDEDTVVTNAASFRDSSRLGARNQGSNQGNNQRSFDSANQGVQGFNQGGSNQGFSQGGSNQEGNRAYLPPFANQRGSSNSRQPFSARNGYRY